MTRAFFALLIIWLIATGSFVALRGVAKDSPLWDLRDLAWLFFVATNLVVALVVLLLATGLISLNSSPIIR